MSLNFTGLTTNEWPENGAMCDVCTAFCPPGERRFSSFYGGMPQSDVCVACATTLSTLLRSAKSKQPVSA